MPARTAGAALVVRFGWLVPVWLCTASAAADSTQPTTPPWFASFMDQAGGVVCGGALVGADTEPGLELDPPRTWCRLTILTAKHCLHPTVPMCAAIGSRLDGCSSPGAIALRSRAGGVWVGDRLSMPDGDLTLVRLKVPGTCEAFQPLQVRACASGAPLELWTWLNGVVHHRPKIPPARACPFAPGADGGPSLAPDAQCPKDWLVFEDRRVTDNACHDLDETAQPRESGGVLACSMDGQQRLAGILSQSCNRVGSFLRSWHAPLPDTVANLPDLTIDEAIKRALRCGVGVEFCKGVGGGADVHVLNNP
jgi:hypothetical protein